MQDTSIKIGVWINRQSVNPVSGGYSYSEMLINGLDRSEFSSVEIVFVSISKRISGLTRKVIYFNTLELIVLSFARRISDSSFGKYTKRLTGIMERIAINKLKKNGIHILYYVTQAHAYLKTFPFIATNWDIAHKSTYAFPEIINNGTLEIRNRWYHETIHKALYIICESEAGKRELEKFCGINGNKIGVLPMFSGKVVLEKFSDEQEENVLNRYGIEKNRFFMYPAQFWPHKNHVNLIRAFVLLIEKTKCISKLILPGMDKSNLTHVNKNINDSQLHDRVVVPGVLTNLEIAILYRNASALVMPTWLGPTNMPPLEAREMGCPVLCSDFEGHREMLQDGAIYFNPLDIFDIANAMELCLDAKYRSELINTASILRSKSEFTFEYAMKKLDLIFKDVSSIRRCWA